MPFKIALDWKHSCWNIDGKKMHRSASDAVVEFLSYFENTSWYPTNMNDPHHFDFTQGNGLVLENFDLSIFEYVGHLNPGYDGDKFGSHLLYKKGTVFIGVKTYDEVDRSNDNVRHLQDKISKQKREIQIVKESLETKNKALDAMHYVWCSGGCVGGVHRCRAMKDVELTEEIVKLAEGNTRALRLWFENKKYRDERNREKDKLNLGWIAKFLRRT